MPSRKVSQVYPREKFQEARKLCRNTEAVAKAVGCSLVTAYKKLREFGIPYTRDGKPKSAMAKRLEKVKQVAKLTKNEQALLDAMPPPGVTLRKFLEERPETQQTKADLRVVRHQQAIVKVAAREEQRLRGAWWTPVIYYLNLRLTHGSFGACEYCIDIVFNQRLTLDDTFLVLLHGMPKVSSHVKSFQHIQTTKGRRQYRIAIITDKPVTCGGITEAFVRGVPAMHIARGEKMPYDVKGPMIDSVAAVGFADDEDEEDKEEVA